MSEYAEHFRLLARRGAIAVALVGVGWVISRPTYLLMPIFILAAAILLARPLALLVGELSTGLFIPNDRFDRPQPMYGIPESRRKEGRPEEALLAYESIVAEHPQEVKAWIGMLDVAMRDLGDRSRTGLIHQRGLAALEDPRARSALTNIYEALTSTAASAVVQNPAEKERHHP